MTSVVIELHNELARWLRASGATQLEVPFNGERWTAKIPLRGLLYTDYDAEWTPSSAVAQSAHDAV